MRTLVFMLRCPRCNSTSVNERKRRAECGACGHVWETPPRSKLLRAEQQRSTMPEGRETP